MISALPLLLTLALSVKETEPSHARDADDDAAVLNTVKGEAKARIQNIEQLLNDWDIEGAVVELAELEKIAPADSAPVRYFRGRVAFELGEYENAAEELKAAGVSDKPGSWLRLARETGKVVEKHETAESEHFLFRYPAGKDAALVPWALEALENIRTALKADLGYAPPGKIRVEIVNDATELSKVSTLSREAIRTTGTIAICKFNKLMVTSPKAVIYGYDWLDTLAHEYTHLVVSKKSRNTVPIWMHEGLAKYLESRWRGPAGGAMTPSTLALLGNRVRKNTLVPFSKMHPSMALLPTAEDAAVAFAEVFFAVQLIHSAGNDSLERLLAEMAKGSSDKVAVEHTLKKSWNEFERGWMASLRAQPFPKELIPTSSNEKKELADSQSKANKGKPKREISFGDFAEVSEPEARRAAHLGELMRERKRMGPAAEQYAKALAIVGNRYESIGNKYALTLLELKRFDEAQGILQGVLKMHPGSAATNVHLGRVTFHKKDWVQARQAYVTALSVNPFDPEVHLALAKVANELGDAVLLERTTAGAAAILKISKERVKALVSSFSIADDGSVVVEPPPASGLIPDAG